MKTLRIQSIALLLAVGLVAGCTVATETELHLTDVSIARQRWLASAPQDYTFEVRLDCFCADRGPFLVTVVGGTAVTATNLSGQVLAPFTTTLGMLWDSILIAQANGRLVMAEFDQQGVPLEAEIGTLANDSGIHYSIRNFNRTR